MNIGLVERIGTGADGLPISGTPADAVIAAEITRMENVEQRNGLPALARILDHEGGEMTRTVERIESLDQDLPESGIDETGFSDIALSLYFSPKTIGSSGIIWGAGPLLLLDTATEDSMGAGKWGAGPAGVVLKQAGPWTIGGLTFYLKDFVAGKPKRYF